MPVAEVQPLGRATEDYLKAIFALGGHGAAVSTTSLAQRLEVSPPAVTKAVRLLAKRKLARHQPYHGVLLTSKGRMAALTVVRRHRLLELFLHDVLGYGWHEVDAEAERLEHHVSDKFVACIDQLLGYPQFDPHGDPIPSHDGQLTERAEKPLASCDKPQMVVVQRVRDRDAQVLQYLGQLGLRPNTVMDVVEKQPFRGPLMLRLHGDPPQPPIVVGHELATHVFVRKVTAEECRTLVNGKTSSDPPVDAADGTKEKSEP